MPALYPALLFPAGEKVSKNPAAGHKNIDESSTDNKRACGTQAVKSGY